jgi:hypothetical protein
MLEYKFDTAQDADGGWFFHTLGRPQSVWETGFPTREEAEHAAQEFANRLREGQLTEMVVQRRLRMLIEFWTNERVQETGLAREDVLLDIGLGIRDVVDEVCPKG